MKWRGGGGGRVWRLQLICEATRILAVKEEPSLITELILHLSLVSFLPPVSSSLAAGCRCVCVCVSVLAAMVALSVAVC